MWLTLDFKLLCKDKRCYLDYSDGCSTCSDDDNNDNVENKETSDNNIQRDGVVFAGAAQNPSVINTRTLQTTSSDTPTDARTHNINPLHVKMGYKCCNEWSFHTPRKPRLREYIVNHRCDKLCIDRCRHSTDNRDGRRKHDKRRNHYQKQRQQKQKCNNSVCATSTTLPSITTTKHSATPLSHPMYAGTNANLNYPNDIHNYSDDNDVEQNKSHYSHSIFAASDSLNEPTVTIPMSDSQEESSFNSSIQPPFNRLSESNSQPGLESDCDSDSDGDSDNDYDSHSESNSDSETESESETESVFEHEPDYDSRTSNPGTESNSESSSTSDYHDNFNLGPVDDSNHDIDTTDTHHNSMTTVYDSNRVSKGTSEPRTPLTNLHNRSVLSYSYYYRRSTPSAMLCNAGLAIIVLFLPLVMILLGTNSSSSTQYWQYATSGPPLDLNVTNNMTLVTNDDVSKRRRSQLISSQPYISMNADMIELDRLQHGHKVRECDPSDFDRHSYSNHDSQRFMMNRRSPISAKIIKSLESSKLINKMHQQKQQQHFHNQHVYKGCCESHVYLSAVHLLDDGISIESNSNIHHVINPGENQHVKTNTSHDENDHTLSSSKYHCGDNRISIPVVTGSIYSSLPSKCVHCLVEHSMHVGQLTTCTAPSSRHKTTNGPKYHDTLYLYCKRIKIDP